MNELQLADSAAPAADPALSAARSGFLLQCTGGTLATIGVHRPLHRGQADTLADRAARFFAEDREGPRLLVGALPFERDQDDHLFQPMRVLAGPRADRFGVARARALRAFRTREVAPEPDASEYRKVVAQALVQLRHAPAAPGALRKVVLARSLWVAGESGFDPWLLAARLAVDRNVTTYVVPLPVARTAPPAWLVGATPELLVSRRGPAVVSQPLAGSIARAGRDPAGDRAAAQRLHDSAKDRYEHRIVIEAIADTLSRYCVRLQVPAQPSLHATETMWHLGTRIEGQLRDASVSSAELAAALHPTPAVCGEPREDAYALIRALEPRGRGFYAGAVGWTSEEGDGDWYVSIRCARVQQGGIRLYAGAGVVAGSVPDHEADETGAKFRALLDALGLDAAAEAGP